MNCLSNCDRRKMECKVISNQMMLVSVEGIHVSGDDLFVCGRGSDVCKFSTC